MKRPVVVCDTECFINYWSIGFSSVDSGRRKVYELTPNSDLDRRAVAGIFRKYRVITFNGNGYDIPMILSAMTPGITNEELKRRSDDLIQLRVPPWVFMEAHRLSIPEFFDHIDLQQVNPGAPTMPSLKLCGGRLHSQTIQDLPIDVAATLTPQQIDQIRAYHGNDLALTTDMYQELLPQIDIREHMSEQYGVDLRSKSDAQIAEAVIKVELERRTRRKVYRPKGEIEPFRYKVPSYIRFESQELRELLSRIRRIDFEVDDGGAVVMPKFLSERNIVIGGSTYRMGIGGLHSTEESTTVIPDADHLLLDRDVTSYYPSIIITQGLYPAHLGPAFLDVYREIFKVRLAAKAAGNKNVAESLKIVLNGAFGKLGSKFSIIYSPHLMIQVTLTGQLALLMLIEQFERSGIRVVSANTDGIVSVVPKSLHWKFNAHVWDWETDTGFGTEESAYRALHSRDVNNYVAVTTTGKVKTKGVFTSSGRLLPAASGLKKNPAAQIAIDAAVKFLQDGTPVETTINDCADVRKFVVLRRVNGGATERVDFVAAGIDGKQVVNGHSGIIGKVIRWYYSTDKVGPLFYAKDGKTVPRSEGAVPIMSFDLEHTCPDDLDRDWYIREAYALLQDVGYSSVDPSLRGRSGTTFARMPSQKTIHTVVLATGIALCGKARESIREPWNEVDGVPLGQRICSKCRKAGEL